MAAKVYFVAVFLMLVGVVATTFASDVECKDKTPDCAQYPQIVCEPPHVQWAKENCRKRCNLCNLSPEPLITTTTSTTSKSKTKPKQKREEAKCWQNWVGHAKGESWRNGCKEECKCLQPSNNFINCKPLCWDWSTVLASAACYSMPPPKGKCCPRPKCQPNSGVLFPDNFTFQ